jgi:hypothetical protein
MKKYLLPQFIVVTLFIIGGAIVTYFNYEIGASALFLLLTIPNALLLVHGGIQFGKTEASQTQKDLLKG